MRLKVFLAVLAVLVCPNAAFAEDCPAQSSQMDDIIAAVNDAPGCDRAMKVFDACAYGASGDVQLGAVVEKKCEAGFVKSLKAPQNRIYQRELRACDRKYEHRSGTQYLSFAAFCRAEVAQRYAHQAQKAAGAGTR
jgi:hypothetical protein